MNDPLGWDYPAGAENDPDAPWNQKDDAPDDERDMDDASDEECGNLTSPSALAAVHPTPLPNGMADTEKDERQTMSIEKTLTETGKTPRTDALEDRLCEGDASAVDDLVEVYDFARTLERERDEAVSELKAERDAHEFTFTSYTMQREENVRMVSQLDNSQAETAEAIAYYKKLEAERLELERIRDADAAEPSRGAIGTHREPVRCDTASKEENTNNRLLKADKLRREIVRLA